MLQDMKPRLILGSSSQSRVKMLEKLGYLPDVIYNPEIDETPLKKELPKDIALRLAKAKAMKVHNEFPNDIVIAADTVCAVGRLSLPKALTEDDVKFCLNKISGRRHSVFTGVCGIRGDKIIIKLGKTIVRFKKLNEEEQKKFIADRKQWYGKAGGYSIMGSAAAFVMMINGDEESNVIGLPLYHTQNIIKTLNNNGL